MKYNQTLIDDEHESSNIATQEELRSISGSINLNHTMYICSYTHLSVTTLPLTQKFKEYNRNNR